MAAVAAEVDPAAETQAGEEVDVTVEVAGAVDEVEASVGEEVDCVWEDVS